MKSFKILVGSGKIIDSERMLEWLGLTLFYSVRCGRNYLIF